jgi:myo-inositol 2-dehydrogenase/D-chiro-inositol 1-dehydrogenase
MLRCGLIGYGAWGAHHARVMAKQSRSQFTAIAAHSAESQARAKADHPACSVHGDYREMLARENLDALAVVLPSHLHFEISRGVLDSGRHLLLEKPMCLNVQDCRALVELAKERGRVLAIGHEMRLSSLWGKVKQLVDDGAIGKPLYALVELWRRPYRLGSGGWRYDIDRVGNWILEEPIHFFDLVRWCFQSHARPVAVFAQGNGKRADHPELHDHFTATVRFDGGQVAVIAQCLGGWEHHQVVKLSGTQGALWASWSGAMDRTFEPTFSLKVQRGDDLQTITIPRAAGEVFELEDQFDRFLSAIEQGTSPAADGVDGLWSVKMCLKAEESVRTGVPVSLEADA